MWGIGCLRRLGRASLRVVTRPPIVSGSWLLLAQPGALAEAVGNRLRAAGANPILVEDGDNFQVVEPTHFRARHGQAQEISAIVRRVRETHGAIQGAIYLGSGSADDRAAGTASYHALVALAEGLESFAEWADGPHHRRDIRSGERSQ